MKFIAALVLAVATTAMAADTTVETTQWTNSKCDADIISQSYTIGTIDATGSEPKLVEYTEAQCSAAESDCNEATGWETKCVGSVGSGPSGYHKYETHVPTSVENFKYKCDNKDGDVYTTAYYFNGCVNEAEAQVLLSKNFTYKSSTNDCANDKTTYYADKDCSGDSEDVEADDDAKDCTTKTCAGCFVATASFDSFHHESVASLRAVRDAHFNNYAVTRAAWSVYMTYGPAAATVVAQSPVLKMATRALLTPVVEVAAMLA